jgi:hypothetical protein
MLALGVTVPALLTLGPAGLARPAGAAVDPIGADAIHAFDIANLHERGDLWQLAPDLTGCRQFLAAQGFGGPLWVTEHGYPSDPQYQYDPGYTGGEAAQASFLEASVPTLVDAGAAEVFITERDNLSGPFASEGVLGGDVADPPPTNPQIVTKPAFAAVQLIAECFQQLGRDCPGVPATASPSTAFLPPVPPGHASTTSVTVTDPGGVPIQLGAATLTGPFAAGVGDGVGYPQQWRLMLVNPFRARVSIGRAILSGADARRFRITSDRCAHVTLRPQRRTGACNGAAAGALAAKPD